MFTALVLAPLAIAATSLAIPTARQLPSGPCAHFAGGFDTASNFTLAALNRTLPNANSTGAPLVLGQAGAIDGAEFEVLSVILSNFNENDKRLMSRRQTWASFPFNQWPSLSLLDGGLTGNMDPPSGAVKTVSTGASNGSEVSFVTTSLDPPSPAPVYCAVVRRRNSSQLPESHYFYHRQALTHPATALASRHSPSMIRPTFSPSA
jgi:hypothetical protein